MTFDYMKQITTLDSVDVEDIGNVALNALNDEGQEWYLVIKTSLGKSTIIQVGPLTADVDVLPNYFDYNYQRMDYKEIKLVNAIDQFLNNPKRMITQVFFTSEEALKERLDGLQEQPEF